VGAAADELPRLRKLLVKGRSAEAITQADRLLTVSDDPAVRAEALLFRLTGLINLNRRAEYTTALDAAADAVRSHSDPACRGRLHALAAIISHLDDSLERCVSHLVRSSRALSSVTRATEDVACAWHDLAMAYSYVGFHGHAISAMERSRTVAAEARVPESDFVTPAIRVRLAVWHDQTGDTDACLRVLRDVLNDLEWHEQEFGLDEIRSISRGAYGYAIARLAALGEPVDLDSKPLLDSAGQSLRSRDLRMLGQICRAIASGQSTTALALLDQSSIAPATMGAAETCRLRALAHVAAGSYAEANAADRRAFRVANAQTERLRDLFVDGMAARMDHENMQRTVARYAGEALTDPLTGLPNRRYLEQYVGSLIASGESAIVGVCDLDGFKAVNTGHGHLSGDLVLQRVAAILARVMRRGDFVARYGGDEFVVVLPGTGPGEAMEIAQRIVAAVAAEDWSSLVPGTPVGVTIGWAEADARSGVVDAFAAADRAMLRRKAS
jgi:diguanylate cyclase (GGDEF)-like protein